MTMAASSRLADGLWVIFAASGSLGASGHHPVEHRRAYGGVGIRVLSTATSCGASGNGAPRSTNRLPATCRDSAAYATAAVGYASRTPASTIARFGSPGSVASIRRSVTDRCRHATDRQGSQHLSVRGPIGCARSREGRAIPEALGAIPPVLAKSTIASDIVGTESATIRFFTIAYANSHLVTHMIECVNSFLDVFLNERKGCARVLRQLIQWLLRSVQVSLCLSRNIYGAAPKHEPTCPRR
ncbi:UNVERIFIED_ORG: hypothetical protein J2Y81_007866 [Paraburkholderia sediminicola]|nr:hypothetical protein [Paraburkholderia sediminicola]